MGRRFDLFTKFHADNHAIVIFIRRLILIRGLACADHSASRCQTSAGKVDLDFKHDYR